MFEHIHKPIIRKNLTAFELVVNLIVGVYLTECIFSLYWQLTHDCMNIKTPKLLSEEF